jgi:hypothetical protein
MHSHFTMTVPSFHFTALTHPSHPHHYLIRFTSLHFTEFWMISPTPSLCLIYYWSDPSTESSEHKSKLYQLSTLLCLLVSSFSKRAISWESRQFRLGYGLGDRGVGFDSWQRKYFSLLRNVQTDSGDHSASYKNWTGDSFFRGKEAGEWIRPLTSIWCGS